MKQTAISIYRKGTPIRSTNKHFKFDIETIRASRDPIDKASALIELRRFERAKERCHMILDGRAKDDFDPPIRSSQWRGRKPDELDVEALEDLIKYVDPHTQRPTLDQMKTQAKAKSLSRGEYVHRGASLIIQYRWDGSVWKDPLVG